MPRVVLSHERLRVEVEPRVGACLTDLSLRDPGGAWWPLMRRAPAVLEHFNHAACYLLAPWCNRIPSGRFEFGGRAWRVPPNWPDGTAIHGEVMARAWSLRDRSPESVHLMCEARDEAGRGWPWAYTARVRYELDAASLGCVLEVRNESNAPMPCGVGFHPYWMRRLWSDGDAVRVMVDVRGRYPARGCIPIKPAEADAVSEHLRAGGPLGDPGLDDVFDGFTGRAEIVWPASAVRVRYECSEGLGHAVVFAPSDRGGAGSIFCLEPVSMVNDGLGRLARGDTATGVRVLAPGESMRAAWTMFVDRLDEGDARGDVPVQDRAE